MFEALADANRRAIAGCEHCGSAQAEDVWHVVLECAAARYRDLRQRLIADVPSIVSGIRKAVERALKRYSESYGARPGDTAMASAACNALTRDAVTGCNWTSPTGRLVLFRLLTVMPFPPSLIPPLRNSGSVPTRRLLSLLGQMFAATRLPRRFLRSLANKWLRWSYKWLKLFGDARCDRR